MFFFCVVNANAQQFASFDQNQIVLNNGLVNRVISFPSTVNTSVNTTQFSLTGEILPFIATKNNEFSVDLNGETYTGNSAWQVLQCISLADSLHGKGASIQLKALSGKAKGMILTLNYLLYPNLALVKKTIHFLNETNQEIAISSIDVENLATTFDLTTTWIYNNYCRYKTLNGYKGNHYDPVILLHSVTDDRGIVLGNEAQGVLKRTSAMLDGKSVMIGMNHAEEEYPAVKTLKKGEYWITPATFIGLYNKTANPTIVLEKMVANYVRNYMGARIFQNKNIPISIYNTWAPFRGDMTTALVLDVASKAKACGFTDFVIDAGWNTINGKPTITGDKDLDWILNLGDWVVDSTKFPNGLGEVFTKIHQMGMKPGLWISVATATKNASIYKNHPDWFVQDKDGLPAFLHDESGNQNQVTACLAGPYFDYIKNTMIHLVKTYGLSYVKLDLSMVTSAYRFNAETTGCYAKNHSHHKGHEDSYLALYERCFQLFDELHREAPDLFIDCTFETMGKLQLIDFAMLKHAEGNWLLNIDQPAPKGSERLRQLAWWRSALIPASSMVIGNMVVDEPNFVQSLNSLSGSMPILLGDTRKLKDEDVEVINIWNTWMTKMQHEHQIYYFRQDLLGFGEPCEYCWDGFARMNTDTKSGGIIGVFRQNAAENQRTVFIPDLEPTKKYTLRSFPSENVVKILTGSELSTQGFVVSLPERFQSALFYLSVKE